MHEGRSGLLFRAAETAVSAGLCTRLIARSGHRGLREVASLLFLGGALTYRYAWVQGGKASAARHADAAAMGRGTRSLQDPTEVLRGPRVISRQRSPSRLGALGRVWSETVRRVSLVAERRLPV